MKNKQVTTPCIKVHQSSPHIFPICGGAWMKGRGGWINYCINGLDKLVHSGILHGYRACWMYTHLWRLICTYCSPMSPSEESAIKYHDFDTKNGLLNVSSHSHFVLYVPTYIPSNHNIDISACFPLQRSSPCSSCFLPSRPSSSLPSCASHYPPLSPPTFATIKYV